MKRGKPKSKKPKPISAPPANIPPDAYKICLLMNEVFYFIEKAFILDEPGKDGFRLIVIHAKNIIVDNHYETVRGAKIAFSRLYKLKAFRENVKPEWSHSYPVDNEWIKELNCV